MISSAQGQPAAVEAAPPEPHPHDSGNLSGSPQPSCDADVPAAVQSWWIIATLGGKPIEVVCSDTPPSDLSQGQESVGPYYDQASAYRNVWAMADKWLGDGHGNDVELKAQRDQWHQAWTDCFKKEPASNQHVASGPANVLSKPDDTSYQIFPDLSPEEDKVLRTSIQEVGVLNPIVKDEQGNIVEGHQRKRLATELGKPCPEEVRHFGSETEKFQFALISNRARRSYLSQRQKRHAIACYLKADPEISNNWLAELIGVSDATVIQVRKRLEASSQIGKFDKLRGKDGKKRPATTKAARSNPKTGKAVKKVVADSQEEDDQAEAATVLPFPDPAANDPVAPTTITVEETKIVMECVAKLGGWDRTMTIMQDCYRQWQENQTGEKP